MRCLEVVSYQDMNIQDAVLDADIRVLLMCVFQLSGDPRWLQPPFAPRRDVRLIADEDAGLSPEVIAEIRAAAIELASQAPAITSPGDALMTTMMSVCLGETIPPEYAPMMSEELGFVSRDIAPIGPADGGNAAPPVLVVGAGPSGIAMAVRLKRLGVAFTVVESGTSVGGVWRDNRYPGCGVDTPNHAYSFSFAPPHQWSRFFAPQPEIETYMQTIAADFGVVDHVEFSTSVDAMTWSEPDQCWNVTLNGPGGIEERPFRFVITAIGQLHEPQLPDIEGLDRFEGRAFHSSRWPDDLDLAGLRVAVVGTGATAMQIVPAITDQVGHLNVVQRSPQWARPIERYHEPIPDGSRWLFENLAFYAEWFRFSMLWRYGDGLLPYLKIDPEWPYPDRSLNRVNERHRQQMADHITSELADRPDLVEHCMPTYPPYGKRILLDNGWYQALCRPNVTLTPARVAAMTPTGFVTDDGAEHEADIVVFATGFQVTQMAARLNITGRDGVNLADVWANDNPTAYLGITAPAFPNLFFMQGPNTGLGHGGSAIFQSECQARHITSCIAKVLNDGAQTIEVNASAHDTYVAAVDAEHQTLIWSHPGMSTYYRNAAGRVVTVMPWRLVDYWAMTHDVDAEAYHLR